MSIFGSSKAVKIPETLAELEQLLPDLVAQAREEGKASVDREAVRAEVSAEAADKAKKETDRIMSLIAAMVGPEAGAQFSAIIASGVTAEQAKALNITLATPAQAKEDQVRADLLAAITAAGADNPGHDSARMDISNMPIEDRCRIEWDKSPDLRAEFGDNFDAYLASEKVLTTGRAKVLNMKTKVQGGK